MYAIKVDPVACDCTSSETDMCTGAACFAKIEIFAEEKTAIMQKGCISDIPSGAVGCQYASNSETVHCFCEEEKCNIRHKLNNYMTRRLPTVECCGCSERHGDQCPSEKCLRKCRGNYCVVDFDGVEQGCGLGFPRLQSFLRMNDYLQYQGASICARDKIIPLRYEATTATVMNGCTCTQPSGICNELNRTRNYQIQKVIERRLDEQNYCYSLSHKATKPFGQEVFRKSTTCEGQYCFISLTTSEIVLESTDFKHNYEDHDEFIGINRPRYELLAGCLKVDDDKKINVGCTTEYITNSSDPLSRHCICDSHLCNFHHLVTGAVDSRPRATQEQKEQGERNQNMVPRMSVHLQTVSKTASIAVVFSSFVLFLTTVL
uniref:Uncharacterized protein n=1 Tax=Heterorhabditis bacteriophora TaxID=37862 RepID=A0A1I7XMG1_HETBA